MRVNKRPRRTAEQAAADPLKNVAIRMRKSDKASLDKRATDCFSNKGEVIAAMLAAITIDETRRMIALYRSEQE